MAYKGRFTPKNPKKYKGDPTNIIYRSLWELRVMKYLDENAAILEWSSEELAIPYVCPTDNRWHRYFPDFIVKAQLPNGNTQTMILEVKPKKETMEPKKKKKVTKQYITEVMTWGKNQAKWAAATEYCADRSWQFKLITEDQLGI
jgi:hypothetical protein